MGIQSGVPAASSSHEPPMPGLNTTGRRSWLSSDVFPSASVAVAATRVSAASGASNTRSKRPAPSAVAVPTGSARRAQYRPYPVPGSTR